MHGIDLDLTQLSCLVSGPVSGLMVVGGINPINLFLVEYIQNGPPTPGEECVVVVLWWWCILGRK